MTPYYRHQLQQRFVMRVYWQRWQINSPISRHEWVLDVTLRARLARTQKQACLLRVLTHNTAGSNE